MRRLLIILAGVFAASFTIWSAGAEAGTTAGACEGARAKVTRDVAYVDDPVSDLQRLDVYGFAPTKGCEDRPVVVYVHGGGWRKGDKRQVGEKAAFFNGRGDVFVSVNYRLSDPPGDPSRPMYPTHPQDVGAAVAWVESHIASSGGDGSRLELVGHSAGGHLVSLVGLDPTYIEDAGGDASAVACVIANDAAGYDVTARANEAGRTQRLYRNAFGTDPTVQAEASPVNHIGDRKQPPDFLVITRGLPTRVDMAQGFADSVQAAGATVQVLRTVGLTHGDVNRLIGVKGDTEVTPSVEQFTNECFG